MSKRDLWYAVYRTCREQGDDHDQACKNATDAVSKAPAHEV